jgi:hypothetical protein
VHKGYIVIKNILVIALSHDLYLLSYVFELVTFVVIVNIKNFDGHVFHVVHCRFVEAVGPPDDTISTRSNISIEPIR